MARMKKRVVSSKLRKAFRGHSPGFTLIEVLIALALFAIIGIVFAGGLATASKSVFTADVRTNAESLARTEMEYVKSQEYSSAPWSYMVTNFGSTCTECPTQWFDESHKLSAERALYTVEVDAMDVEGSTGTSSPIEEITVTVSHDGRHVITLVGYKIDR